MKGIAEGGLITFCLGFYHWHREHLTRCLASLERFHQRVLLVAGHEMPDLGAAVEVVFRPMQTWSRSYALNEAAALARTPYLCFTDADMIFPSNWYSIAKSYALSRTFGFFLTDSRDLQENMPYRLLTHSLLDDPTGDRHRRVMLDLSTPHDRVGQGGGMIVPREWFLRVGGFDEFYRVWAAEDNDLVQRIGWDGFDVEWLPNTFVAHQWHRRDWPSEEQVLQVQKNRDYFRDRIMAGGPIIRNGGPVRWGEERGNGQEVHG